LTPELLSPTSVVSYRVYYSGESYTRSPIRTMLKVRGSRYTLLAANIERQAFGVRFDFARDIASVRRLNPDGSRTLLRPQGQRFSDSLGQFGVGVYEIRFRHGPHE
jgi:hypothetical protein